MLLIKSDPDGRVNIPGVPDAVSRPIDIDCSRTGFSNLRTLRIYRFDKDAVIEGHAEEDEVFLVVLSGTIKLTITSNLENVIGPVKLSAPIESAGLPCAAYLPPGDEYKLIPDKDAFVAYARATPLSGKPAELFSGSAQQQVPGVKILWENNTYAQRLRVRMLQVDASQEAVSLTPIHAAEARCEVLVHLRSMSPLGNTTVKATGGEGLMQCDAGDTLAISPGEQLSLRFSRGSAWLVFIVLAESMQP